MEQDTCIGWNILMKFCVLPVFQDICTCEWCIQSQFVFTLYRFSDHQFARVFLKYSLTWTRSLWLLCHNTCPLFEDNISVKVCGLLGHETVMLPFLLLTKFNCISPLFSYKLTGLLLFISKVNLRCMDNLALLRYKRIVWY